MGALVEATMRWPQSVTAFSRLGKSTICGILSAAVAQLQSNVSLEDFDGRNIQCITVLISSSHWKI